ncbi:unnamed protein product [Ectocarpus sp. CCAP 1310/34]|nr:unnamed protein product [Ectocarpus sp. CCAP 1310/34]
MSVAAVECAHSLEAIVKASKLLAHQVSQTYFMALSTAILASVARLFACNLHLGGRLLLVHGALLRTFLVSLTVLQLHSRQSFEGSCLPPFGSCSHPSK